MKLKALLIVGLLATSAFGQLNTLVQTRLSSAIDATQSLIVIASSTGIVEESATVAGSALWVQDIGQSMGELMNVISIAPPGSTGQTVLNIRRSANRATSHLSGAMVLIATAPNWFQSKDPRGSCTTASTYVTPWLNTENGLQWVCSAKTLNWIPGWGNYKAPREINAATAVASVAGVTAAGSPLIHISGTEAITSFQMGIGWYGQGFCVIPDGAYTTVGAGPTATLARIIPVAIASTAVANQTQCFTYDFTNTAFTPSY